MDDAEPIYRLLYASRIAPSCSANLKVTLPRIVANAIVNNQERGITSLLGAYSGWFVQVLEGPKPAVVETFGSIAHDHRHHGAEVLTEGPAEGRLFGQWSMAARSLTKSDPAVRAALDLAPNFDPTTLPERRLIRLLAAVADAYRQSLARQQSFPRQLDCS